MRKKILWTGIIIFVIGVVLGFLAGANPPAIPGIYGNNQVYWLFLALVGLEIGIVGLILKKKR